jgi:lambda repressor-like predicted transcriptional regulator
MIWVDIPSWETRYEVSEYGDVRSKDMVVNARNRATAVRKGRVLANVIKTNGYACVTLTNGINRPQIGIHRIVARAFIGECPLGLYVLHNDGNKLNNHYSNLRYGTQAENVSDTKKHGHKLFGSSHPRAILSEQDVVAIRLSDKPYAFLANLYGVCAAHIGAVKTKRAWKHI